MKKSIFPLLMLIAAEGFSQKNLILNGDFEKDSIGFQSQYKFVNNRPAYGAGEYFIHADPAILRYQWAAKGKGKFMIVDGADKGAPYFWKQTVTVNPKKTYLLKFSLCALYNTWNMSRAEIGIFVDNDKLTQVITPVNENSWPEHELLIQPRQTKIEIVFAVLNPSWSGNDFGMDNISLTEVKKGYKPKLTESEPNNFLEPEGKIVPPADDMLISVINVEGVKEELETELPAVSFNSEKLKEAISLVTEKDVTLSIANATTGENMFSNVKASAGRELKFDALLKSTTTRISVESFSTNPCNLKVIVNNQTQTIVLKAMQRIHIIIKR